jgi:hypothetical protein
MKWTVIPFVLFLVSCGSKELSQKERIALAKAAQNDFTVLTRLVESSEKRVDWYLSYGKYEEAIKWKKSAAMAEANARCQRHFIDSIIQPKKYTTPATGRCFCDSITKEYERKAAAFARFIDSAYISKRN